MENDQNNEVYSKVVRAGKRTYFFDVKSTKGNDLYLTITESKKVVTNDGRESFQKHKLFLYKEDFDKFQEGLDEVLTKISSLKENDETYAEKPEDSIEKLAEVSFEDL